MGRSGSGGRGSEAKLGGARDVRSDGQVAARGRGEERLEGDGSDGSPLPGFSPSCFLFLVFENIFLKFQYVDKNHLNFSKF
jgi:hypothetical protein